MSCSRSAITPKIAVSTSMSKKVHMKRAKQPVTMIMIQSLTLVGSRPPGNRRSKYLIFAAKSRHCTGSPSTCILHWNEFSHLVQMHKRKNGILHRIRLRGILRNQIRHCTFCLKATDLDVLKAILWPWLALNKDNTS